MKRVLLALLVAVSGGLGSLLYLSALAFRLEPPELDEMEGLDVFIGALLGTAAFGAFHLFQLPRFSGARMRWSTATGIMVWLLASGSLISWHRHTLAVREQRGKAAIQPQIQRPSSSTTQTVEETP